MQDSQVRREYLLAPGEGASQDYESGLWLLQWLQQGFIPDDLQPRHCKSCSEVSSAGIPLLTA